MAFCTRIETRKKYTENRAPHEMTKILQVVFY